LPRSSVLLVGVSLCLGCAGSAPAAVGQVEVSKPKRPPEPHPDPATDMELASDGCVADTVELGIASVLALTGCAPKRRLRGDWEPPETLLLAYTHEWRDSLAELIAAAQPQTHVFLLASDAELEDREIAAWFGRHHVSTIRIEHDTPWVRDYGPIEVLDERGRRRWVDLSYYDERPLDDALPEQLARLARVEVESYWLQGEGGALAGNGRGVCAMTQPSLEGLLQGMTNDDRLESLMEMLGCHSLAVVPALANEQTGHVDVLVQFLGPELAVVAEMDPKVDREAAEGLDASADALAAAATAVGQKLDVIRVPMHVAGEAFFTYVNGTRLRERFLVPYYYRVDPRVQSQAYSRLREALPGVTLVPIHADPMVLRGGAVHCLTLGLGTRLDPLLGTEPDSADDTSPI